MIDADHNDYLSFLTEFGFSAEWVWQMSSIEHDQVAMPPGWCAAVADSPIHGRGMFAIRAVGTGEVIAPARIDGKRTPAGRYTNHSARPNAQAVLCDVNPDGNIMFHALRPIAPGEEITLDYRQACRMNGLGNESQIDAYRTLPRREQMTALIADLMTYGDKLDPILKHTFCNGMYMRELFIPAGTLLAGVIHKVPCLNICSSGDIEILTEHGMMRAGAGFTVASSAGTQKIGYTYADTVWINVFKTDCIDVAGAERELFMGTAEMIAWLDPQGQHFTEFLTLQGSI